MMQLSDKLSEFAERIVPEKKYRERCFELFERYFFDRSPENARYKLEARQIWETAEADFQAMVRELKEMAATAPADISSRIHEVAIRFKDGEDVRGEICRIVKEAKRIEETPKDAISQISSSPSPLALTENEEDAITAIRESGVRLSLEEILGYLSRKGKVGSHGTFKPLLAAMVRHGLLTNKTDKNGSGYGLPEW